MLLYWLIVAAAIIIIMTTFALLNETQFLAKTQLDLLVLNITTMEQLPFWIESKTSHYRQGTLSVPLPATCFPTSKRS